MFEELVVYRGDFRVELVHIGEGFNGDYDETDTEDRRLIRFYTFEGTVANGWTEREKGSYCTQLPTDTPEIHLLKFCGLLLAALNSSNATRVLQTLTWTKPENLI